VISGVLLMLPSLLIVSRGSTGSTLVRDRKQAPSGVRVGWLVGVELVLATLLLVGAGLTARSAGYLSNRDIGVVPDGVLTMYFGDVEARPVEERVRYFRAVLDAVGRVPGVVVAGTNDYLPFEGEDDFTGVRFTERPVPAPGAGVREEWRRVSEGVFEAAGMQIRVGRGFVTDDYRAKPAVLVVNSAFVAKHYPGGNPIGRRLSLSNGAYRDMEIVGVVADVLARGPSLPAPQVIYAPYPGNPRGHVGLYGRVHGDPLDYTTTVRDAIWSVEGRQPVLQIRPLGDLGAADDPGTRDRACHDRAPAGRDGCVRSRSLLRSVSPSGTWHPPRIGSAAAAAGAGAAQTDPAHRGSRHRNRAGLRRVRRSRCRGGPSWSGADRLVVDGGSRGRHGDRYPVCNLRAASARAADRSNRSNSGGLVHCEYLRLAAKPPSIGLSSLQECSRDAAGQFVRVRAAVQDRIPS